MSSDRFAECVPGVPASEPVEPREFCLADSSGHKRWLVRVECKGHHWCDFAVYKVCYEDEHGAVMFLPNGWESSPGDARPWSKESETTFSGYVKWDGCTEFESSDHFCGAAESYAELYALIQFTLAEAHAAMTSDGRPVEWEPVDPAPLLAASRLNRA